MADFTRLALCRKMQGNMSYLPEASGRCSKCGMTKPAVEFKRNHKKRNGLDSWCLACSAAGKREHYRANRKSELGRKKQYQTAEWRRRYRAAHADELRARARRNRAAKPEMYVAHSRAWRDRHPERNRAAQRLWRDLNPEAVLEMNARRRARIRGAIVGKVDYARILERDGLVCHLCRGAVEKATLSYDHVVPLSLGGSHTEDNIKVAHRSCNYSKGARMVA